MKTYCKAAILSCLVAGAGIAAYRRWTIRMPFKEFTRYALYMAVMDDEICRHELEGNRIGEEIIKFPPGNAAGAVSFLSASEPKEESPPNPG